MSERILCVCSGMWTSIALLAALVHSLWILPAFGLAVGFWVLAESLSNADKE